MHPAAPWRIQTFGGFSIEREGIRYDRFRTQHVAVLLTYLSLKPDVRHSREALTEILWPEIDPLVARQRLSTALSNVRKTLEIGGPPVLVGGRDSVGIHPGMLASDAFEFNRLLRLAREASRERRRELLRQAMRLAGKGEFLPGFYFDWVVEQASRFDEALDAVRSELETRPEEVARPAEDPSSLVGRTAEIEALDRLLANEHRCISILGAGGVGKTRLALDLFERHARRFSGATAFVRLAEIRQPSDFLPAISRALLVPAGEPQSLLKTLAASLAVPGLIVLDNLEHLLPGIHPQLDALVRACGHSTFVCTSRRRLDISGEQILRVRPLRLPGFRADHESPADAPAIRLFQSRYQEAGGSPLPPESLPTVVKICRALDGLPLAIQLAASAAVAVGVEGLGDGTLLYPLLPSRHPDGTNPHRSLAGMIEWSLTLLAPETRQGLDALCMLPGSFDVGMVRRLYDAVAAATLPTLHSDSLLEADGQGGMRVLEPIREHVRAQMDPAYRAKLEVRLVERCAVIAKEVESRLEGNEPRSATEDAKRIWPTMRLATQLAAEHQRPNEGLAILIGFYRAFVIDVTPWEAIDRYTPLMALPGIDPRIHAHAHAAVARHIYDLGRYDDSFQHCLAGLELARQVGDLRCEARCTYRQGLIASNREDRESAIAFANRALHLGRQSGDVESQVMAKLTVGLAHALFQKGATEAEARQALAATDAHMSEAVAIARESNDEFLEAFVQYYRSGYDTGSDLDLFHARVSRAIEIFRRNGWKLREAIARSALVRRLYTAGRGANILEELHALQQIYAESGHRIVQAEQVGIEAEILFRMDRFEEALTTIEDALRVLRHGDRSATLELHIQALIYCSLGKSEAEVPLLSLVERSHQHEFNAMMGDLARALLEVRREEDARAFRRLLGFQPKTKPNRVQHAFADTLVAFADIVSPRNPGLAITAYRRSRIVYREIKSAIDLHRVRHRVAALAGRCKSHRAGSGVTAPTARLWRTNDRVSATAQG